MTDRREPSKKLPGTGKSRQSNQKRVLPTKRTEKKSSSPRDEWDPRKPERRKKR